MEKHTGMKMKKNTKSEKERDKLLELSISIPEILPIS